MRVSEGRTGLRAITDGRARVESQAQGLKIVLRSTPQLDSFPQAKEAFLRAAALWESVIQTPITIIVDVDFGPTIFGEPYPSSFIIGATDTQALGDDGLYPGVRSSLALSASNGQQATIFNALPVGALPTDSGPTSLIVSPSAIFRVLGFLDPVADPTKEPASQFGNPPSIGFNSAFTFDFDPSDGIDFNKIDFNAAAVHEIGHALGFESEVGLKEIFPSNPTFASVWDFYRVKPGITLGSFTGAQRLQISGGTHVHFAGGNELLLSTARPDGVGGDGSQASHWKDDINTGQFIGIMDPSASDGLSEALTANDLVTLGHFGYSVRTDTTVTESLSIDGAIRGAAPTVAGALVVNRLTPSRYPATVKSVRVSIPVLAGQPSPAGAPLRIVVFNDPARTGQPPSNPQFLFDQSFNIPNIASTRFVEFTFNGPTINAGDIYIGVQATGAAVPIAIDTCPKGPFARTCTIVVSSLTQNAVADADPLFQRSFISQNNGASFQSLQTVTGGTSNATFMARAVVSEPFNVNPVPDLAAVSPNVLPLGGQDITLTVLGKNFQSDTVVRWNDSDRPTTLITGSRLEVAISASDLANMGTATVTVFTPGPGGGTSTPLSVNVTTDNPVPGLIRVTPNSVALGSSSAQLQVFGGGFTPNSIVRFKGSDRPTVFVNTGQLTVTLPASDLATEGLGTISVFNPGPGGGLSDSDAIRIVRCSYALSFSARAYFSAGAADGVTLTTDSACGWTASADVPWITITNPDTSNGAGKYAINYTIAPNTTPTQRTGKITIGGQTINVREYGLISTVSAASFAAPLAPDSIAAAFGVGLATDTLPAPPGMPLPTTLAGAAVRVIDATLTERRASLFYASPGQINYLVPTGTAAGNATVAVVVNGTTIVSTVVNIAPVAPSLFAANSTGKDAAAAVILRVKGETQTFEPAVVFDQTLNRFVNKPIDLGPETDTVFLVLYGTGIRGFSSLSNISIKLGDVSTPPQSAAPQGEFIGLDQINVPIPRSLIGRGEVTVSLTVDGKAANPVTIAIK